MSHSTIKHNGIVKRVESNRVLVEIVQQAACAECHAKMLCSAADSKTKEVEVAFNGKTIRVGDSVVVRLSASLGFKAVRLAFVYPAFLLLFCLLTLTHLFSDVIGALGALGCLLLYYIVLALFRNNLKRTFSFELEQPDEGLPLDDKN